MGIYVKGMTKPKSCYECPIALWALPKGCNLEIGICPIVEVAEPHGRLIDVDEICFCMTDGINQGIAEKAIRESPTVIEAEDKHED